MPDADPREHLSPGKGEALTRPGHLTVSELNSTVRHVLQGEPGLQDVWVLGELSNLRPSPNRQAYPTLKDGTAEVRCVIWAGTLATLSSDIREGEKVLVHGSVDLYLLRGTYQLKIDAIRKYGIGDLYAQREALRIRLKSEGLFDRKRPLPRFPETVGIVTSETGATLRDMLRILGRRFPSVRVVLIPVLVQGVDAPADIVAGIEAANRLTTPRPEVLLVGRGGGSIEDLWAFNDEAVVRAIFRSEIPVVSAVGHETDVTLADFAADRRAATPSEAAEIVVPDAEELLRHLRQSTQALATGLSNRLKDANQQTDQWAEALRTSGRTFLDSWKTSVEQKEQLLRSLNPRLVLKRGYAFVRRDGETVKSVANLHPGDSVEIVMHDGEVQVRVQESRTRAGTDSGEIAHE